MTSGSVGWKLAQLTPRSCPSKTYFTTASVPPNRSEFTLETTSSLGWRLCKSAHKHTQTHPQRGGGSGEMEGYYTMTTAYSCNNRSKETALLTD